MRTKTVRFLGVFLLLCCAAGAARATQYPPGPGGANPDTLIKIEYVENPGAIPHPIQPDTVWGIGGIITGFDNFPTGFGFYIQNSQGGSWSGVDVFTGGNAYNDDYSPALALGDSVMVYGRIQEFNGLTEIQGFQTSGFTAPLPIVRRISTGNPLPPFHLDTVNGLKEPTSNANAEQWEGTLVKVTEKLRVARTTGLGLGGQILVSNAGCAGTPGTVCDSMFIDGSTLSFVSVGVGGVGALVDSVQGIYGQATRGYRIQLRDVNDIFDPNTKPSLADAYFITPDTIRVLFDHNVTLASAQATSNYTIGSTLGAPTAAIRQVKNNIVHLKVTPGTVGAAQSVTASGIVSTDGQTMVGAQVRNMYEGIVSIAMVQAPQPDSLAKIPCEDRSAFASTGGATPTATNSNAITIRGVCTGGYTGGQTYFLETAGGGARTGIQAFATISNLQPGHQYVLAGRIQEFFNETQFTSNVYVRDEGVVGIPAPTTKTVSVLRNSTCDAAQSLDTAEDYEGMLVKVINVKTAEERSAGQSFGVGQPFPSDPDTILIDSNMARTFDPQNSQRLDVTGILELASSFYPPAPSPNGTQWRIQPRGDSDIVPTSQTAGVGELPKGVSFAVSPNPARLARVTFALPQRDRVRIGVYDLAGRLRAVLADREFPAGSHSVDWNGVDTGGKKAGSGVFFYRLTIAGKDYNQRGVLLN